MVKKLKLAKILNSNRSCNLGARVEPMRFLTIIAHWFIARNSCQKVLRKSGLSHFRNLLPQADIAISDFKTRDMRSSNKIKLTFS